MPRLTLEIPSPPHSLESLQLRSIMNIASRKNNNKLQFIDLDFEDVRNRIFMDFQKQKIAFHNEIEHAKQMNNSNIK